MKNDKYTSLESAASKFMELPVLAIAGVSRKGDTAGNAIYNTLKKRGYNLHLVHPYTDQIGGNPAWPDIASIPKDVDGLIITTPPEATIDLVKQCYAAGVTHVWMHKSIGQGSVNEEAVEFCREKGISVIPGGCPLMFVDPVDIGHKCIRWLAGISGNLRTPVESQPTGAL